MKNIFFCKSKTNDPTHIYNVLPFLTIVQLSAKDTAFTSYVVCILIEDKIDYASMLIPDFAGDWKLICNLKKMIQVTLHVRPIHFNSNVCRFFF